MKKVYILCFVFFVSYAYAQERLQNTLLLGKPDADKLFKAYARPAAIIGGLTQTEGWHHSARPLKPGNVGIQIIGNVTLIPEDEELFDLRSLGLQNGIIPNGETGNSATVLGPSDGGAKLLNRLTGGAGGRPDTVRLLNGNGLPVFPLPTLQFNVGFIRNTELNARVFYIPISFGDREISFTNFGFGFKHDLKQWIPSIALSNFSLSLVASYNKAIAEYDIEVTNLTNNPQDQQWVFNNTATSFGILASKRFPILTLMGGLRYDNSKTRMDLKGTYLVGDSPSPVVIKDPISQDFTGSRLGLNLGFKLKLGWFSFHIIGTASKYSSVSVGLGFGKNE
ncbi:MAG: hypothetical protein MUC49_21930 [Raineya sp.]|jgi:hypothetical protein|nr:hypothetical protein [Raineya sp.]